MSIEEVTDSGADSQMLMELMEINEALDEAQTPEEVNKIGQDTKGKLAVCLLSLSSSGLTGSLEVHIFPYYTSWKLLLPKPFNRGAESLCSRVEDARARHTESHRLRDARYTYVYTCAVIDGSL